MWSSLSLWPTPAQDRSQPWFRLALCTEITPDRLRGGRNGPSCRATAAEEIADHHLPERGRGLAGYRADDMGRSCPSVGPSGSEAGMVRVSDASAGCRYRVGINSTGRGGERPIVLVVEALTVRFGSSSCPPPFGCTAAGSRIWPHGAIADKRPCTATSGRGRIRR